MRAICGDPVDTESEAELAAVIYDSKDISCEWTSQAVKDAKEHLSGKIVVLLGAGASVEAGVPASFAMTEAIVKEINDDPAANYSDVAWALNFVCGALKAYNTSRGSSYLEGLDVEFVVSAVNLLASRRDHEAAPFVSAWHPAVEEIDLPRVPASFDKTVKDALGAGADPLISIIDSLARGQRPNGHRNLKSAFQSKANNLANAIKGLVDARAGRGTGRVYGLLQQEMVSKLCGQVYVDDATRVRYLYPLVHKTKSQGSMVIGSLNYDRTIEMACEVNSVGCQTGIDEWSKSRVFPEVSSGVKLLKMHGSIDWETETDARIPPWRLPSARVVQVSDIPDRRRRHPVIVFGGREKLRADGPFLDLLREWEAQLEKADVLLIVGYSFRDNHINETIRRWINGSDTRHLFVVDPGWNPDFRSSGDFRAMLENGLAPRFPHDDERTPHLHVIKAYAGEALEALFS